jgi:hypothetical protein
MGVGVETATLEKLLAAHGGFVPAVINTLFSQ